MKPGLIERMTLAGFMKAEEANNPLVIVLRMLAFPVVIFCIRIRLHPNIVTGISIALGCSGALFYFLDAKHGFIIAWAASVVLDYADGTVARKTGKESHFGYLFDMLGDRVKLVFLVIAWSLVEASLLGIILAILVIAMLFIMEVIYHLLIRHVSDKPLVKTSWEEIFLQIFLRFHMHSFLLYGVALYLGGTIALIANIWLILIMFLDLKREFLARIYCDGKVSVQLNDKLFSKFTLYRSRGGSQ